LTVFSQNYFTHSIINKLPEGFLPSSNTPNDTHKKLTLWQISNLFAYYLLTAVLLFSGIAKIIDPLPLLNILKQVTFLPAELQIIIATLLPVVEICLALLMLTKSKLKLVLPIVAMLFAAFLAFSIYGIFAGLGADCGCFGNVVKSSYWNKYNLEKYNSSRADCPIYLG